jgi:hypothetical protein
MDPPLSFRRPFPYRLMVVFACHILTKRVEEDMLSILFILDSNNVGDGDSCIKKINQKLLF